MPNQKIQVFIADDHQTIIDGIKTDLIKEDDLSFAGSANSEQELKSRISDKVDVLLLDVFTKDPSFFSLIKDILNKHSSIRILILSGKEDLYFAKKTIEAGVRGYISKVLSMREILQAIREVVQYPDMTLIKLPNPDSDDQVRNEVKELLTSRELQVIAMLSRGFPNNEEIAEFLCEINKKKISALTVQAHRRNIRNKLRDYGVTNDASLGYWISEWKLLDGSELSSTEEE